MKSKHIARGTLTVGMFAAGPILYAAASGAASTTKIGSIDFPWTTATSNPKLTREGNGGAVLSQVSSQIGTASNGHRQFVMNLDVQGTCDNGYVEASGAGLTSSGTVIAACTGTDSTADGVSIVSEPSGICDSARQWRLAFYCINPCSRSTCQYIGDECRCTP